MLLPSLTFSYVPLKSHFSAKQESESSGIEISEVYELRQESAALLAERKASLKRLREKGNYDGADLRADGDKDWVKRVKRIRSIAHKIIKAHEELEQLELEKKRRHAGENKP